ncbi:MAG: DUF2256 domain-containing protein [Sphingobium sp.]
MTHGKLNLPSKICQACQRSFTWRKKWERDWEQVKYCSDRCRSGGARDETARAATHAHTTSRSSSAMGRRKL